MKRFLFASLIVLALNSCQDDFDPTMETLKTNINATNKSHYAISEESALANLATFMTEDNMMSRSSGEKTVKSISAIKCNGLYSRSSQDSIDCENLLYVANFEEEQGYAILAGDTRISEPVIAVVDTGYLSDAVIYTALDLAYEERIYYEDYPTSGPGFFTMEETGDELFMNPNTVILYVDSIGDTLVGNLDLSDEGCYEDDEDTNSLQTISTLQHIVGTDPQLIAGTLCATYALGEIVDYIPWEPVNPLPEPETPVDDGILDIRTVVNNSGWNTIERVSPILSKFKTWEQGEPFNDLYPERRQWIIFGKKRKSPAGCFPLAIAKLLTHFEYPSTFKYNNYSVDWKELKNDFNSYEGKRSAAHLLKGIADGCGSLYFYQGTFTFPHKASGFMRDLLIPNVKSQKYKFDKVIAMLQNGCPVIISSVPGIRIDLSHAWNIDGYKIKERTITTKTYLGDVLQSTTTETETCEMIHCDFGWGGIGNGHYVSGVFKLGDDSVEYDSGSYYSGDTRNYNNLVRIITYDKPI